MKCPKHNIDLEYTNTKYGKRYACPECDVVLWEGSTSTPADYETRQLRRKCHSLFDKRWKNNRERNDAYTTMAHIMGIKKEKTHFGMFNKEQCEEALKILNGNYW